MVCVQVMGNDAAIGFAGSQGNFELNVFKPVMILNFLHSVDCSPTPATRSRALRVEGIAGESRSGSPSTWSKSLMLVTALNPHIGYDNAAKIAKNAHQNKGTLKDSAIHLELLTDEEFDRLVVPSEMTRPGSDLAVRPSVVLRGLEAGVPDLELDIRVHAEQRLREFDR